MVASAQKIVKVIFFFWRFVDNLKQQLELVESESAQAAPCKFWNKLLVSVRSSFQTYANSSNKQKQYEALKTGFGKDWALFWEIRN